MKRTFKVGIYKEAHWLSTAEFKRKWQAYLFHILINTSKAHTGTREY